MADTGLTEEPTPEPLSEVPAPAPLPEVPAAAAAPLPEVPAAAAVATATSELDDVYDSHIYLKVVIFDSEGISILKSAKNWHLSIHSGRLKSTLEYHDEAGTLLRKDIKIYKSVKKKGVIHLKLGNKNIQIEYKTDKGEFGLDDHTLKNYEVSLNNYLEGKTKAKPDDDIALYLSLISIFNKALTQIKTNIQADPDSDSDSDPDHDFAESETELLDKLVKYYEDNPTQVSFAIPIDVSMKGLKGATHALVSIVKSTKKVYKEGPTPRPKAAASGYLYSEDPERDTPSWRNPASEEEAAAGGGGGAPLPEVPASAPLPKVPAPAPLPKVPASGSDNSDDSDTDRDGRLIKTGGSKRKKSKKIKRKKKRKSKRNKSKRKSKRKKSKKKTKRK
jgi:hypothetical protein